MENVTEEDGVVFDFNNLPDDILWVLFNKLSIPDRRTFGRVCKKWYEVSRHPDPIFWKKVVVFITSRRTLSMALKTMKLLRMLPQCVSSLKLYYDREYKMGVLTLSVFSLTLLKMCPNLEELIIVDAHFTDAENLGEVNLSNTFCKKLRILKFREVGISSSSENLKLIFEDSYTSNIEVFDISYSDFIIDRRFLSQMPRLRQLHLAGLVLKRNLFDATLPFIGKLNILDLQNYGLYKSKLRLTLNVVRNNCFNLTDLYICFTKLRDRDVGYLKDTTVLPQLKVLCVRACPVTFLEINSLIDLRPSLQLVYVGLQKTRYEKPEYDYDQCNSVKVIHRRSVDINVDCEHEETQSSFKNTL